MDQSAFSCVDCAVNGCEYRDGKHPAFCPTTDFKLSDDPWLKEQCEDEENYRIIESAAYSAHVAHRETLSHLEETVIFARKMGVRKIGIAACVSLADEARAAAQVFRAQGCEVVGAICKMGSITFGDLGVPPDERGDDAVLCNPIYQAKVLNEAKTDLNVVMGLCAGHDALFLKYAESLCTLLTAKDFKFDHCSIRALRPDDESGDCRRLSQERVEW